MRSSLLHSVAIASVLACAPGLFASRPPLSNVAPYSKAQLKKIDQAYADRGALSTSLRQMDADLRVPSGWDSVYELTGPDGAPLAGPRRLARVSGGITAVFPFSEYEPLPRGAGIYATIPAGTVYHIGGVAAEAPRPSGATAAVVAPVQTGVSNTTQSRINSGIETSARATPPRSLPRPGADRSIPYEAGPAAPSVLQDETARVERCRSILLGAARFNPSAAESE